MPTSDCSTRPGDSFRLLAARPLIFAAAPALSVFLCAPALIALYLFGAGVYVNFSPVLTPFGAGVFSGCVLGLVASPLFSGAAKLALRLAKTGSFRRAADSEEARFWSRRFFVQTLVAGALGGFLLGATILGGYFAGVSTVEPETRPDATVVFVRIFVALLALSWVAATLEFLAFELAENRAENVFRAFAATWRSATAFAFGRVLPIFLATTFVFWALTQRLFPASGDLPLHHRAIAAFFAIACAALVYVFFAVGPVAYLAATKRRLFCEKTDAKNRND